MGSESSRRGIGGSSFRRQDDFDDGDISFGGGSNPDLIGAHTGVEDLLESVLGKTVSKGLLSNKSAAREISSKDSPSIDELATVGSGQTASESLGDGGKTPAQRGIGIFGGKGKIGSKGASRALFGANLVLDLFKRKEADRLAAVNAQTAPFVGGNIVQDAKEGTLGFNPLGRAARFGAAEDAGDERDRLTKLFERRAGIEEKRLTQEDDRLARIDANLSKR